jgi:hypothetical protein
MPVPTYADPALRRRRRRKQHREHPISRYGPRLLIGLLGGAGAAAALALAAQHPLSPVLAVLGVLLVMVLARYFWTLWPGWMLGLLPCIALAPWTGWLLIEEFDLIVLASIAGGYFAISGPHRHKPPPPVPVWRRELRWRGTTMLLMALAALSALGAAAHGIVDAGGLVLSLQTGYRDSGAPLRAVKAVLWLMLMLPLWHRVARRTPQTLTPSLLLGTAVALAGVCLGALYERIAFTGLADFDPDYRTTGFFWEQHLGSPAMDAALVLLLPFVLLTALRGRRAPGFALAAGLLFVAVYVVLTTFSRGLYLALLLALPLCLKLWFDQEQRRQRGERDPAASWLPGQVLPKEKRTVLPPWRAGLQLLVLMVLSGAVAWSLHGISGLRGLLGVAAVLVALLAQPPARAFGARVLSTGLGLVLALPLLGLTALVAMAVDKAAYLAFGLTLLVSLWLGRKAASGRHPWASPLGDALRAGAWFTLLGLVGVVTLSWGGQGLAEQALVPLGLMALAWPIWHSGDFGQAMRSLSWRVRLGAIGLVILMAAVLAALGGSSPWAARLAHMGADADGRVQHWSRTLAAIDAEGGWVFGSGAGRFVSVYSTHAARDDQIGHFKVFNREGMTFLNMNAGRHPMTPGQMLRVSQRVSGPATGLVLNLKVRNEEPVELLTEVCVKHLLYSAGCVTRTTKLEASPDAFKPRRIELGGAGELGNHGLVFSVALAGQGNHAQLADLSLRGSDGQERLRNGNFAERNNHWLHSSDKYQLPWQAKNIGLHIFFEQGVVGLVLALSLVGLALGRLLIGSAREHALAPAFAAALIGFLLLGLWDSLIDAPRIAFLSMTLLALSLGLRGTPPPVATPPKPAQG